MRVIITLSLVLFPCFCFAQQTFTYQFNLNKAITAKLSDNIGYIHVADARSKKDNFGYIREYSTKKILVTDGSFQDALGSFANKHFIANPAGSDTVFFVIRDMCLEQNPINMDVCTIYMKADIFRGRNDQYKELCSIDTFCLLTKGNMPRIMFSRFTELLGYCIVRGHNDALYSITSATYSIDEAIHLPEIEKSKIPAYNTKQFKRGVYLTPDEFLMQTPSITSFKVVEYGEIKKIKPGLYHVDTNGKLGKEIKAEVYTIYNGDEYKYGTAVNMNDYMSWVIDVKGRSDNKRIRKLSSGTDVSSVTEGMSGAIIGVPGALAGAFVGGITGIIGGYLSSCRLMLKYNYKTHKWMPVKLMF